jgi:hypothetical protein
VNIGTTPAIVTRAFPIQALTLRLNGPRFIAPRWNPPASTFSLEALLDFPRLPNSSNIQSNRFISSKYELFTHRKNLCSFVSTYSRLSLQKSAILLQEKRPIHPVFRKIQTFCALQKISRLVFSTPYELLPALQNHFYSFRFITFQTLGKRWGSNIPTGSIPSGQIKSFPGSADQPEKKKKTPDRLGGGDPGPGATA